MSASGDSYLATTLTFKGCIFFLYSTFHAPNSQKRDAFDSAKIRKRQRRKRQSS